MKKQTSLRWKILLYLLGFVFAMISLIWIFQTVFLDDFYQSIKTRNLGEVANQFSSQVSEGKIQETIDTLSNDNEVCIRLVQLVNTDFIPAERHYVSQDRSGCAVARLTGEQIADYWQKAVENNGDYLVETVEVIPLMTPNGPFSYKETGNQDIILAKVLNQDALVLVSTRISPVNSTIETLKVQLIFISGIICVLAVLLAVFMTLKVTRPLEEINQEAQILATGNYDVQFTASGYKEINELNNTMNVAAMKLKEVDQIRRDLISNVSHDLRTPLTMIEGYSEMMRDLPGENTPENAQVIMNEAHRLSVLVNDLLDLSRLQENKMTLHLQKISMSQLLKDIVNRYQKYVQSLGMEIVLDADEAWVVCDLQRMEQVIYNFINNAIQYSNDSKRIEIVCRNHLQKVRVEVRDFGIGISEDQLSSIWERYYKIDREHVRFTNGSGIGLSICKEILELHQAEYGAVSAINQGTTFWFEFPGLK